MKTYLSHSFARKRRFSFNGSLATFIVTFLTALIWSDTASAQALGTFGDMLCSSINNGMGPMPDLLGAIAYISGTFLIGQGLYLMVRFHDNSQSQPLHPALTRMGGGAFLLAMPSAARTVIDTLITVPGGAGIGVCASGVVVAGGVPTLTTLLNNFVGNVKDPMTSVISDAAIVIGIFFIMRGLIKASKYGMDAREYSMPKILSNLVVGAILMVVGQSFDYMLNTLFGNGSVVGSFTNVAAWPIMGAAGLNASPQFIQAVESAGIFFELVGMIAFVRGWLIMKSAAEGTGQATMAQGITHMLGGVLAMNIFNFLQVMDNTFGTGFL